MEYKWTILAMECIANKNGFDNIVKIVDWRLTASQNGISADYTWATDISGANTSNFVAYEDLTPEIVIEWVKKAVGAEKLSQIETDLAKTVKDTISPPITRPNLPWGTT